MPSKSLDREAPPPPGSLSTPSPLCTDNHLGTLLSVPQNLKTRRSHSKGSYHEDYCESVGNGTAFKQEGLMGPSTENLKQFAVPS